MMVDIDAERLACGSRRLCVNASRRAETKHRRCSATEKLPPGVTRSF